VAESSGLRDLAICYGLQQAVVVILATGVATVGNAAGDTVTKIEGLTGTSLNDSPADDGEVVWLCRLGGRIRSQGARLMTSSRAD